VPPIIRAPTSAIFFRAIDRRSFCERGLLKQEKPAGCKPVRVRSPLPAHGGSYCASTSTRPRPARRMRSKSPSTVKIGTSWASAYAAMRRSRGLTLHPPLPASPPLHPRLFPQVHGLIEHATTGQERKHTGAFRPGAEPTPELGHDRTAERRIVGLE